MKNYIPILFFCLFALLCNAQKSTIPLPPPSAPYAEGCEDASDPYYCTDEKLKNIAYEALQQTDIDQVLQQTKKDTIFMNTKLYFYESGYLDLDASSLKFHERELKFFEIDLSFSLDKLPLKPSTENEPKKTGFSNYLFLKVDRENKKLIPLPNYEPERIPFSGPEKYIVYPGCESKTSDDDLKKCMSNSIIKHVGTYFDTALATKLNLNGIQRIYVTFSVDKEGEIAKVKVKAPHPKLAREARRVIKSLPKMIPGEIEDTPVSIRYTLPIVFKVQ